MDKMNPAIVVAACNRPQSLKRILNSLKQSTYSCSNIDLVISIDHSDVTEVTNIAEEFLWEYGQKRIIKHRKNLGLRQHILKCGDLTQEYGAIIMLEDDLFVSPYFYEYAQKALAFYNEDSNIAGISLYSPHYDECSWMFFSPCLSGYSNYFKQVPSSWGQCWTRRSWLEFRTWYEEWKVVPYSEGCDVLPSNLYLWPETSWKKYFFKYMIMENKQFVYPYNSYSTNFTDIGENHKDERTTLQVPLMMSAVDFNFVSLHEASIIYDSHTNPTPRYFEDYLTNFNMKASELVVDLYGTKKLEMYNEKYVLTCRNLLNPNDAIATNARKMKPHELNIRFDIEGDIFILAKNDPLLFQEDLLYVTENRARVSYYYGIRTFFLKG